MSTTHDRNAGTIEEFRSNHGRVGRGFQDTPLLLLHTVGARSGQPRVNPMYLRDGDRCVVFATKGGGATNPDWYHNVRAHPMSR
jgi:deazaflavin-dependent oxidoreductase (nitroreductase family)